MTYAFGITAPADDRALHAAQLRAIYRLSDALHRAATLEEIFEIAVAGVIEATGGWRWRACHNRRSRAAELT